MRPPCKIDGCDRPSRGRGWCATHWRRWKVHGDPLTVLVSGRDYNVRSQCTVDDCGTAAHAHGFCVKHLHRYRKHGSPHVLGAMGRPLKGEHPTWDAIHKRLARIRGRAAGQVCADCSGVAQEWSYDGTDPDELLGESHGFVMPYSLDLDRYQPRCCSCHRLYDARRRAVAG